MKQGDKFPVTIAGQEVAQAEVREVGDGQVTLVVPGTIVVMAVETNLAPAATTPEQGAPAPEPAVEHQILGVDRVSTNDGATVVTSEGGETPQPTGITVTAPGEVTTDGPRAVDTVPVPQPQNGVPGAENAPDPVAQPAESPTVSDEGNSNAQPSA